MAGIYGRKGILIELYTTTNEDTKGEEQTSSVVSVAESDIERRTRTVSSNNRNKGNNKDRGNNNERDNEENKKAANNSSAGCVICFEDDDHSNLLLCESCDAEYHIYCLQPPLRSVPEGDFHCEKCKPFVVVQNKPMANRNDGLGYEDIVTRSGRKQNMIEDDGLDEMVNALPPKFTTRFGDILWAAGGVGFGWWPAYIYDPRFTIGVARTLAKKHLGKKHLVYFFECHDAPFTVLSCTRLINWEDGLMEEFDIGKAARNIGKSRSKAFDKALMLARMELDKPKDMRMYSYSPKLTPPKKQPVPPDNPDAASGISDSLKKKLGNNVAAAAQEEYETTTRAGNTYKRRCRTTSRIASFLCTESLDEKKALARALHLSACEASQLEQQKQQKPNKKLKPDNKFFCQILIVNQDGQARHDSPDPLTNTDTSTTAIENAVPATVPSSSNVVSTNNKSNTAIIGFISISTPNYSTLTFANTRVVLQTELDEDMLPTKWKFYIPTLGPLSIKQEEKSKIIDFILEFSTGTGAIGSKFSPFQIFIMNCNTTVAASIVCAAASGCSASLSVASADKANENIINCDVTRRPSPVED